MAKYNYDKSALKGLGVGAFLNQVKTREAHIEAAGSDIPRSVYNPNILADKLHPNFVLGKITDVQNLGIVVNYTIAPFEEGGFTQFPYFKAGQYISFEIDMGDRYVNRSYALACSPKSALGEVGNTYQISVSDRGPGHVSEYIHKNWQVGTVVVMSAPQGKCYYEPLRDAKDVLFIGTGTTGISMALAIADGIEDFNLTVLNLVPDVENPPCVKPFEMAGARSGGKVRREVVGMGMMPGTGDPGAGGQKPGPAGPPPCPVTSDILKKYLSDPATGEMRDTTIFIQAQNIFADPIEAELKKLGVPRRRIRKEYHGEFIGVYGEPDFPKDKIGKDFKVRVWVRGEYTDLTCGSGTSLLTAIENANVHISSDCHAGQCGWCHSRLISGEYFMPKSCDGRREADRKFGWIHPCATYPLSDIELEVFPVH